MRIRDRLLGSENDVRASLRTDMRQVAKNSKPIHLSDYVMAEVGETSILGLVAASSDYVLCVVGDLDNPDAEFLEELEIADLVLNSGDVLPAENDPRLVLGVGLLDVGGGIDLRDQIGMLAEPGFPAHDVAHGFGKTFPHATGAVRRSEPSPAHVFEDRSTEIGDDQPINDDGSIVQSRRHFTLLAQPGDDFSFSDAAFGR